MLGSGLCCFFSGELVCVCVRKMKCMRACVCVCEEDEVHANILFLTFYTCTTTGAQAVSLFQQQLL